MTANIASVPDNLPLQSGNISEPTPSSWRGKIVTVLSSASASFSALFRAISALFTLITSCFEPQVQKPCSRKKRPSTNNLRPLSPEPCEWEDRVLIQNPHDNITARLTIRGAIIALERREPYFQQRE